jgi:hypothetical protein
MNATDWIAGYAAAMGTAALSWEMWRVRQARRLRVTVRLGTLLVHQGKKLVRWATRVEARNHGDHRIRVTGVGLYSQDGTRTCLTLPREGSSTLPGVVEAHDSGAAMLFVDRDGGRSSAAWLLAADRATDRTAGADTNLNKPPLRQ